MCSSIVQHSAQVFSILFFSSPSWVPWPRVCKGHLDSSVPLSDSRPQPAKTALIYDSIKKPSCSTIAGFAFTIEPC